MARYGGRQWRHRWPFWATLLPLFSHSQGLATYNLYPQIPRDLGTWDHSPCDPGPIYIVASRPTAAQISYDPRVLSSLEDPIYGVYFSAGTLTMVQPVQAGTPLDQLGPDGHVIANGAPVLQQDDDPYEDDAMTVENTIATEWVAPLGTLDVFSFIVNKMIGTGVYSAPATTYLLTGDKRVALGLWVAGLIYSFIRFVRPPARLCHSLSFGAYMPTSMGLYLDYAAALPYTGGELVYVSHLAYLCRIDPPPSLSKP